MSAACSKCGGTGSLSKRLDGDLDCAACDVAVMRARLNVFASEISATGEGRDWLIFQAGMMVPPPDFVLVPVTPTPAMLEALAGAKLATMPKHLVDDVRDGYRKMLAAIPKI